MEVMDKLTILADAAKYEVRPRDGLGVDVAVEAVFGA